MCVEDNLTISSSFKLEITISCNIAAVCMPPSAVVPAPTTVTTQLSTVASSVSDVVHVTDLFVASDGVIVYSELFYYPY